MSLQQPPISRHRRAAAAALRRTSSSPPSPLPLLRLLVLCIAALTAAALGAAAASPDTDGNSNGGGGFEIRGRVSTSPDGGITPATPLPPGGAIELVLTTERGARLRTFAAKDGAFALRGVPPGGHTVAPLHPKFVFPEVRIDVGRDGALKRASFTFNGAQVPVTPQLVIPAAGLAQYYEARRAFDLVAFIKTPYGLMLAFSVFAIVVMPMLKVDPEEYREAMASLRGGDGAGQAGQAGPQPSLVGLHRRAGGGGGGGAAAADR